MDKLVLNIPRLQETVKASKSASEEIAAIHESVAGSNKKLAGRGVWTGGAADAYSFESVRWANHFEVHGDMAVKMHSALKAVYDKAANLNRQALGFAGKVGGSSGAGFRNLLTYDPGAEAVVACDEAMVQIEAQLRRLTEISGTLSGTSLVSAAGLRNSITAYCGTLSKQKTQVRNLYDAVKAYASEAESLAALAVRAFDTVVEPTPSQTQALYTSPVPTICPEPAPGWAAEVLEQGGMADEHSGSADESFDREMGYWAKMIGGVAIGLGGSAVIVAALAAAAPAVAVLGLIVGVAALAYGSAEIAEAARDIFCTEMGYSSDGSVNPLRDCVLAPIVGEENKEAAYDTFGWVATTASFPYLTGTALSKAFALRGWEGAMSSMGKTAASTAASNVTGQIGTEVAKGLGLSDPYSRLLGYGLDIAGNSAFESISEDETAPPKAKRLDNASLELEKAIENQDIEYLLNHGYEREIDIDKLFDLQHNEGYKTWLDWAKSADPRKHRLLIQTLFPNLLESINAQNPQDVPIKYLDSGSYSYVFSIGDEYVVKLGDPREFFDLPPSRWIAQPLIRDQAGPTVSYLDGDEVKCRLEYPTFTVEVQRLFDMIPKPSEDKLKEYLYERSDFYKITGRKLEEVSLRELQYYHRGLPSDDIALYLKVKLLTEGVLWEDMKGNNIGLLPKGTHNDLVIPTGYGGILPDELRDITGSKPMVPYLSALKKAWTVDELLDILMRVKVIDTDHLKYPQKTP